MALRVRSINIQQNKFVFKAWAYTMVKVGFGTMIPYRGNSTFNLLLVSNQIRKKSKRKYHHFCR